MYFVKETSGVLSPVTTSVSITGPAASFLELPPSVLSSSGYLLGPSPVPPLAPQVIESVSYSRNSSGQIVATAVYVTPGTGATSRIVSDITDTAWIQYGTVTITADDHISPQGAHAHKLVVGATDSSIFYDTNHFISTPAAGSWILQAEVIFLGTDGVYVEIDDPSWSGGCYTTFSPTGITNSAAYGSGFTIGTPTNVANPSTDKGGRLLSLPFTSTYAYPFPTIKARGAGVQVYSIKLVPGS